jgi:lipopolysaccharide heptosyltransferase II
MPDAPAWEEARRVLCVRLDAVGDVLMTTPALRAVKTARRDRTVTLLTSPAGAAVAGLVPEIDAVMVWDAPWMKAAAVAAPEATMRLVSRLRAQAFDAAIVFTVATQSALPAALVCHLAGIPLRLAHCRENPYQLLTDWVREPDAPTIVHHEVTRQLALVATVGCRTGDDRASLRVPPDAIRGAVRLLAASGIEATRPWVALHPGASAPSRRYPADSFAAVATRLAADGFQILWLGSAAEAALVDAIRARMARPSHSLAGATTLAELAALLARTPVLIANNSGPAHLAAAVGTPVVVLYALTNPQHTPWRVASRVLFADVPCRNCFRSVCPEGHHQCLAGVAPAAVVAAAHALLGRPRAEELTAHREAVHA